MENGNLAGKTQYVEGKMKGLNESYFFTGQVRVRGIVKGNDQKDSTFIYYSTGKVKELIISFNGRPIRDKKQEEIDYLYNKYYQSLQANEIEAAYKYALELVEFDSTRADSYIKKGFALYRKYFFDKAISEFDKALEIEPLLGEAFACRALARIHKHQFSNSGLLTKDRKKASLDLLKFDSIPSKERDRVCHDLQQSVYFGFYEPTISNYIHEAIAYYCQKDSSR